MLDYAMGANPVTALSFTRLSRTAGDFLLQWGPDRTLDQIRCTAINPTAVPLPPERCLPGSDGSTLS